MSDTCERCRRMEKLAGMDISRIEAIWDKTFAAPGEPERVTEEMVRDAVDAYQKGIAAQVDEGEASKLPYMVTADKAMRKALEAALRSSSPLPEDSRREAGND